MSKREANGRPGEFEGRDAATGGEGAGERTPDLIQLNGLRIPMAEATLWPLVVPRWLLDLFG
jgi:hypothetical protein